MEMYGMMGEHLGPIGPDAESLPAWKKDFLSKPSISIRKGIAWGTQPAFEDTSTLVLTTPSSKFIDVRYPISARLPSEVASHPSFWAFSGEAATSFYDESKTQPYSVALPYTAYCKFVHDIDTKGHGIVDAGDTCLLPNGDGLEFGHMVNPQSGQDEPYKEYWCSAEPIPKSDGTDDAKSYVVAQVAGPTNVDGLIIRVGGRLQGITLTTHSDGSEEIQVERWIRDQASANTTRNPRDTWSQDSRSSGSFVPCDWMTGQGRKLGENLEFNGILWNIIEAA